MNSKKTARGIFPISLIIMNKSEKVIQKESPSADATPGLFFIELYIHRL